MENHPQQAESYREAFAGFDPARVARFDARRRATLMKNPGIVRTVSRSIYRVERPRVPRGCGRSSGASTATLAFRERQADPESKKGLREIPASTAESDAFSSDLRSAASDSSAPRSLCFHAGGRNGERPRGLVLSPPGDRGAAVNPRIRGGRGSRVDRRR